MSLQSKQFDLNTLPKSVFIFGCGYVGSALAERLIALGVRVGALTRNSDQAEQLRMMGVSEVITGNLHEPDWLREIADSYAGVVNCVSSAGGGIEGYRLSYVEGQKRICEWVKSLPKKPVFVYTSSTSVYPQSGGVRVDESADVREAPATGKVLLESEVCIENVSPDLSAWYILRLAGIYGPRRHFLLDQIREGDGVIPSAGDYTLNMIHRDDAVDAILISLLGKAESGVYNICDNSAAHKEIVMEYLAEQLKMAPPVFDPAQISPRLKRRGGKMPDRVIDNSKARAILGWGPEYHSFREGYSSLLKKCAK